MVRPSVNFVRVESRISVTRTLLADFAPASVNKSPNRVPYLTLPVHRSLSAIYECMYQIVYLGMETVLHYGTAPDCRLFF